MFALRKPGADCLRLIRERNRELPLTYPEVGRSRVAPPAGYNIDHYRVRLGFGRNLFARACEGIRAWQMFRLSWLEPTWPDATVEEGALVGTLAHIFGIWTLNVCRIVYVVDENAALSRFGFAYGTLPGHVECGEERFCLEWDSADDSVWYDILAFSRPGRLLTRLTYPFARRLQKRFAQDSMQAMLRWVDGKCGEERRAKRLPKS